MTREGPGRHGTVRPPCAPLSPRSHLLQHHTDPRPDPSVLVRNAQRSIRVNAQWRICFVWRQGGAEDVELVYYH